MGKSKFITDDNRKEFQQLTDEIKELILEKIYQDETTEDNLVINRYFTIYFCIGCHELQALFDACMERGCVYIITSAENKHLKIKISKQY